MELLKEFCTAALFAVLLYAWLVYGGLFL